MSRTLLLVDADGDCARLVSLAAKRANYEMLLAENCRQAFELVRDEIRRLDLVVVDVDPGAGGLALVEAVSACAERPPVIVVTSLEETYMKAIGARCGAAACLGKPLRLGKFLATFKDLAIHRGLTSDRWGSLRPRPAGEWIELKDRFRGISMKLSPTRRTLAPPGKEIAR